MNLSWFKNKAKNESGIVGVAILAGAAFGGIVGVGAIVGTTLGAIFVGGIVGAAVGMLVEEVIIPAIMPDIPELSTSPTYKSADGRISNTISEGIFISRCYGKCKIGGNQIRFNDPDDSDLRVIIAHCLGEVEGITRWEVNDIEWSELNGSHTKSEYKGTRSQTPDARFSDKASAYRSIAYTATTFVKDDRQIGINPRITVVMEGLLCAPLAGGADAFTRNNAVTLYDWYLNVEGYSADDLDLNAFKSLEALCDEVPSGSSLSRYRFDFNIDTNMAINDIKKLMWQAFNGLVIMSQGKLKPVWDSGQMADGAGGLTVKTVSHAFTLDNIVKGSFTWSQPERPNVVRIHYKDSDKNYKNTSVEMKDEHDISITGEILHEEKCWYITDAEIARRRCKYKFNKSKYANYEAKLTAFSGADDLELYDLVTITHPLPGWSTKQFLVTSKSTDQNGKPSFTLLAYYSGVYDDSQVGVQTSYESNLPNPYQTPSTSTNISSVMTAVGTSYDFDAVRLSFTPPAGDPYYAYSEVFASNDNSTYYYVGKDGSGLFTFSGLGVIYEPGDTCYIKIRSVSTTGVKEDLPATYDTSVLVSSTIRLGGFYAGLTFFGDNETATDAKILLDKTNTLIRVGPTSGDHVIIDGDYGGEPAVVSSNYASGVMGSGFLLKSDLLEVGNLAFRGIIRTAVLQKDVVSAVGGNLAVLPADLLDTDMTALDSSTMTIEGNETFAVNDILRIKNGLSDEWFEVTNAASAPTYTVTRDKAGSYVADSNPAWKKGASVINYRASGNGLVYMTASDSNAPYLSVATHAGSPWSALTTRLRLGNLNGFLGYGSDLYGIAIGEADKYLKYDPTNGLQIKGEITVTGGNASITFYQASEPVSGMKDGDYWIDTDDGNLLYVYDTGSWNAAGGTGGGIESFRQSGIPTAVTAGDLWIDTDDNKLYRATNVGDDQITSGEWELQDAAIATGWAHVSDTTKIDGGDIYADSISLTTAVTGVLPVANSEAKCTDVNADQTSANQSATVAALTGHDLDDLPDGSSYGRMAITSITGGKVIVAGLDSGVTGRMFLDSTTKNNIEAWRHASDVTLIDGGDIYANTITAAQINVSTLSAISANIGTVTAGIARSSDSKFVIDFTSKHLKVYDASSVLRVHLGYIP